MLFYLKQDQNQEAGLKDELKDDGGKNKTRSDSDLSATVSIDVCI